MDEKPTYSFEVIDHTADRGLVAYGSDLAELFEACAYGMFSLMADLNVENAQHQQDWNLEAEDLDDLLVSWLRELLFSSEVDGILWTRFRVSQIHQSPASLTATTWGIPISQAELHGAVVKAVTYHGLEVKWDGSRWRAQVIFDV